MSQHTVVKASKHKSLRSRFKGGRSNLSNYEDCFTSFHYVRNDANIYNVSTFYQDIALSLGILLFLLAFFSCNKKEKYPGFTESQSGLFYKIKTIGEGNRTIKPGDYLLLQATYRTENDSLLSDSLSIVPYLKPSFKGSFEEIFEIMNEGDTYIFIVPTDSIFRKFFRMETPLYLSGIKTIKVELKLNKILSAAEVAGEREKMNEDKDIEEQRKLKQYILENKITYESVYAGMYCLPLKSTEGIKAEKGKRVTVNYKGFFLDGRCFDSNSGKTPLEFAVGDQYQVIEGLEYGISLMREGEKTKFIIPSHLAYGKKGSSTGIVPPYTTVVYEVELLTVK